MLPFGENDFLPETLSSVPFSFISIACKFLRVLRKITLHSWVIPRMALISKGFLKILYILVYRLSWLGEIV